MRDGWAASNLKPEYCMQRGKRFTWTGLVQTCGIAAAMFALLNDSSSAQTSGPALTQVDAPRYALIIGNSKYSEVSQLPNVASDLQDVCAAMKRLRFIATCLADLPDRKAFLAALEAFEATVPPGSSVVLYYAGHAVQVAGENYLIPTGVSGKDPRGWLPQFVRLSEVFQATERARAGFQFIALDACRDDPNAAAGPGGRAPSRAAAANAITDSRVAAGRENMRSLMSAVRGAGRMASYGISAVRDAPPNTLVLFATGAGASAFDGEGERNGPLTKQLLVQIQRPHLQIDQAVKNIIQAVGDDTQRRYGERQSPSLYGTFSGEFCFNVCPQLVTVQQLEEERRAANEERERAQRERLRQERSRRDGVVVPSL